MKAMLKQELVIFSLGIKNLNLEASMKKAKAVDDKGNNTTQP